MEVSLNPKIGEADFPDEPSFRANAVPVYWEPIMGSGERIAAIVAVAGMDGDVEVVPVIRPAIIGVMFPGQKRNAQNMLSWVSSSLKRHLLSGLAFQDWKSPISGFEIGNPLSSLGEDATDIVSQVKLLHSSLASADQGQEEVVRTDGSNTESIRASVLSSVRKELGTEAERFIVDGGIKRVEDGGRNHFLEITFEDTDRVGSVVSAFYTTTDTVKKHILGAQTDLMVAAQGKKKPVMYIAAPNVGGGSKTGNTVDELEWRLSKMGVAPIIFDSADCIAKTVCESWA